jgi:hypothetical protein
MLLFVTLFGRAHDLMVCTQFVYRHFFLIVLFSDSYCTTWPVERFSHRRLESCSSRKPRIGMVQVPVCLLSRIFSRQLQCWSNSNTIAWPITSIRVVCGTEMAICLILTAWRQAGVPPAWSSTASNRSLLLSVQWHSFCHNTTRRFSWLPH